MSDNKPTVAVYCRSASANDLAIKAQEETLRNYAAKNMLTIGEVYSDNGANGLTLDRPAFQRMMADIEQGKSNCIIVKNTSRISRNYSQFGRWLDDMKSKNIRVIAVDDFFDSDNCDALTMSFEEAVKKYYKESHSQRIKNGIAHSRRKKLEQVAKLAQ